MYIACRRRVKKLNANCGFSDGIRDVDELVAEVEALGDELADELDMKRRDVLTKCVEMHVPVLKGRIDRTLFESSLRAMQTQENQPKTA